MVVMVVVVVVVVVEGPFPVDDALDVSELGDVAGDVDGSLLVEAVLLLGLVEELHEEGMVEVDDGHHEPLRLLPFLTHHDRQTPLRHVPDNILPPVQYVGSATMSMYILFSTFLVFFACLWRYPYMRKENKQLPPGPVPWPVVGNLPELFFCQSPHKWILGLMRDMKTDIACIKLGNVHVVPVTSPAIAREFLKQWYSVFASRPLTMVTQYSSFGYLGITLTPWGDQWKKMRRIVATKILSNGTLGWLAEKRSDEANNLITYIYKQYCKSPEEGGGHDVDVRQVVRQYSGNVIRRMMFNLRYFGKGSEDGGPGAEEVEHVEALFSGIYLFYAFCVSDYVPCLRPFDLNGHEKIIKNVMKTLNKYHDPVIEKRMEEWRSGTKTKSEDLLDVFISLKDSGGSSLLTLEEIKAEVADLMYATVDNPSNAVEWVMAEMLNQPEILHKAVEEIDRIVGKDRLVQESDIPRLNYVKACIREAFRLHPNVPFNPPHLARSDTTVGGYFIPKGSHVLLSRTGLGRNPQVWDDPLVFKPECHLMAAATQVELVETELRFISFSTGRRGCMAPTLGTAITVMLLARLLQGFTWTIPHGISRIDLSESEHDLILARSLKAHAKPRLAPHLYPKP
ncbi:hypothetical protein H6P81_005488 [Aristolochia fimbriata]|uniref:Cytochrome P450 n=1 Tax=Aristolochia fimbriata TaxID=158543 RepID=A0AAV7EVR8_ARIFI|nr:hypothetical protein H6P81_005488 [Aristolochia fimbriata]